MFMAQVWGGHGSGLSEARNFCAYVATHLFMGPTCGKLATAREYARALQPLGDLMFPSTTRPTNLRSGLDVFRITAPFSHCERLLSRSLKAACNLGNPQSTSDCNLACQRFAEL